MEPLAACDITYTYTDHVALQALSLTLRAGEVLALIGPNGAGKTTLLRILARLLRPRTGTVLLAGEDAWRLSAGAVARQLALAPHQETIHWPVSVEQAIALGRAPHRGWLLPYSPHDRQAIERALLQTGLQELRHRLLTELSGGEQRRVVLARSLAQEPRVLLLDEPTAHLDLKYQAEVLSLARRLACQQGLSVVMALHDLNQAALCAHRIALLSAGTLLAHGTPEAVLIPSILTQAYGVPVVVTQHPVYGTPMVAPVLESPQETARRDQDSLAPVENGERI